MDPLTIGAIAAPIVGGLFGKMGQSSANKANAREAALNRQFQASQAVRSREFNAAQAELARAFAAGETRLNRTFQERMSNSAYQRSMTDMKKAGLNPMLAYMKGGASTPPGGAASGPTASSSAPSGAQAQYQNENAILANSATNIAMNIAQIKNIKAQTNKTNIDAAVNATQLPKKEIGQDLWEIIKQDISGVTSSARDFQKQQQEWWKGFNLNDALDKADAYVWKTMEEYWGKKLPKGSDPNKLIKVYKR